MRSRCWYSMKTRIQWTNPNLQHRGFCLSCGIRVRSSNTGTLRTKIKYAAPDCRTIAVTELNVTTSANKYVDSIKEPRSVYDILDTWWRPLADRGTATTTNETPIGFWNCFKLFPKYNCVLAAKWNRLSPRTQKKPMFTKINLVIWFWLFNLSVFYLLS
jgi:hypothetical protein